MGRRRARQRGPAGGVPIAGVLVLTTQDCRRNPRRDPTVPICQAANPPGCLMSDPRHIVWPAVLNNTTGSYCTRVR